MSNPEKPKTCPNCSGTPMGEGCYHICYNSIHYYSPEQERQDEANYDPTEYYREGGFADPDLYPDGDEAPLNEEVPADLDAQIEEVSLPPHDGHDTYDDFPF